MVWISRIHADSCRTSPFHRLTCDNRSPRRSRERGRPHPEPAMRSPCSLGRVPTSVTTSSASCASTCPRSWRSCTRSSTSAIQTRFGVTSTPAPRGSRVRSRGSRAPCTVPCVSGARPRPCGPVGSGRPCFLRTAGGTGVRGDAEQSPSIEDARRRPRARSQRPRCSTGGCGTTCCTKDTGPSRATQLVRPPSVSPSVGLRMRSIVPSARAALGVLGHARSDARTLNSFGNLAMPLFSFFHLSVLLQ